MPICLFTCLVAFVAIVGLELGFPGIDLGTLPSTLVLDYPICRPREVEKEKGKGGGSEMKLSCIISQKQQQNGL